MAAPRTEARYDRGRIEAQRVRHHLRRPIPGSRDLLMETAGNTVSAIDPQSANQTGVYCGMKKIHFAGRVVRQRRVLPRSLDERSPEPVLGHLNQDQEHGHADVTRLEWILRLRRRHNPRRLVVEYQRTGARPGLSYGPAHGSDQSDWGRQR